MKKTTFALISTALGISVNPGRIVRRECPEVHSRAWSVKIRTAKACLYAGTENAAYVSFDDGDRWLPLQLNMPTTSVRDLVVHGDDLVAATYGRAFWILDDLTPLRQIDNKLGDVEAFLFRPEKALRVRLDQNQDTPLPPEMPAGQNPPNGAILDFYLKSEPAQDVTLAIYDSAGRVVREFSTRAEKQESEPPPNVPDYWLGHPEPLTKKPGHESFCVGLTRNRAICVAA